MTERPDDKRQADAPGGVETSRDRLSVLAEQQAALRRVATLVAEGVSPSDVFSAVTQEMARCLNVENAGLFRYDSGDAVLVAECAPMSVHWPVGDTRTLEGDNIPAMVLRAGRAVRMDTFENAAGSIAARARELGLHSAVGVPVVVDGRLWGGSYVASTAPEPLPADTEARVGEFAELVATAIAASITRAELQESRDRLSVLAEQQAALRRVATLVAEGVSPSEVFSAVADEMARCVRAENTGVLRYEPDGEVTIVSGRFEPAFQKLSLVGSRWSLEGDNIPAMLLRSGRAARMDTFDNAAGPLAARARGLGFSCAVAVPIVIDGRVWGLTGVISSKPGALAADTEQRIGEFADLVATAIVAAASRDELIVARDELIASRARIVASADDARRRLERDLHDGAQQRLVTLGLQARMAEAAVPAKLDVLRSQLSDLASGLSAVSTELQEISRGIHPAILSDGGLGPALKTLARRCPIPANVDVLIEGRLPEPIEVAAYYVVAEALTNAAKYAQASQVNVCAEVKEGNLCLSIQDDGIGGADSQKGSGLIGLNDRIEVLGGHMKVISPPRSGTSLHVTIPLNG